MANPTSTRSTAGFRSLQLVELSSGSIVGLPYGVLTLEPYQPFGIASGSPSSTASGSTLAAGTTVSGSAGYYGILVTGAQTLTISDPAPRVLPHTGEDTLMAVQILPSLEPITGELKLDKTSDTVDAVIGAVKKTTVGEANLLGLGTSQRGFELQVGGLAYSAAEDTDVNSSTYGTLLWDFRMFPKALIFSRDTGYTQEVNTRTFTFQPIPTTSYPWGVQFTAATEGFTRAQMIRGVSQYKPVLMSFFGNGATQAFPFDSARPAASTAKITVWVNGVLNASVGKTLYGLFFTAAPANGAIITVFYETP